MYSCKCRIVLSLVLRNIRHFQLFSITVCLVAYDRRTMYIVCTYHVHQNYSLICYLCSRCSLSRLFGCCTRGTCWVNNGYSDMSELEIPIGFENVLWIFCFLSNVSVTKSTSHKNTLLPKKDYSNNVFVLFRFLSLEPL